jgi:endonuclease VIII
VPEGHTIHRLALEHGADLVGQALRSSSPQGRFADGAARLDGHLLVDVEPYGKHLFYEWDTGDLVHVHLGLYGKFLRFDPPPQETRLQVRLRMVSSTAVVDLIAPTRCEILDPEGRDSILARLGPDPLRPDADPEPAFDRILRSAVPIGRLLMDQAVLAGVGNVYRAELLYAFRLHPETPGKALGRRDLEKMWTWLVTQLRRGVEEGAITTRPEAGERARWVYKQEECAGCGTPVRRWDMGGRWAYACESCQPVSRPA